jgi:nucleoside-diphosphate-sugar epimerase
MSSIVKSSELLKSHLQQLLSDDIRIVINGASGWLGSNISETLYSLYGECLEKNVLLTASSNKVLRLRNKIQVPVHEWSKALLEEFAPTHIVQLAFKTRDHVKNLPPSEYLRINTEIIRSANWMISLPSVKGFLHTSSGAACDTDADNFELNPYGYLKRLEELEFEKSCIDFDANYLGVRVWSTSGAYIKTGGLLAIESLITQALTGDIISIESALPTYRTYADANEILIASLNGLLRGKTGLYNSGGFEIEIGGLANIISQLVPGVAHNIIRPEYHLGEEDRFCSSDPSVESFLLELGLTFSDVSGQVRETIEFLKEVR